jgi:mono/diheme cytochrome c family protein
VIPAALAAAIAAFAVVVLTTGGGERPTEHDGAAIFVRMGCGSCHRLAATNSTGPIGPDLDDRLQDHTRESLTAQILSPAPTSEMPPDFGERMSDSELDALVDFLLAVR